MSRPGIASWRASGSTSWRADSSGGRLIRTRPPRAMKAQEGAA
jgi:hypothetical protein